MNLQAQRDLSIAGDVVGRDKITINITRGLDELPTRYDSRVQNFLEYYLGAKDHPAPFGGRASDLAALDAWLNDPAAPPYASLIAPAGRGKSALLAHWVTRLASRSATGAEAVHVVYFPISIRFNTNLETVVFASLAARMAHIYGEKVTQAVDAQQYRGVFSDYLRRIPPNGGRVLVVLDGLDEAAGWEAGADLFPTVAPGHLRVIVAARPLALDKDEIAWLNRLGWEMRNRAQRISLAGLDREGVRDVLSQMGNPLNALATKIDLISRLYELSAGDPLLVRLYVEALLPQGAQAAALTPEDLAKLQPGLEAYFKRWFDEQQKLWGAAKPLQDKTVRGLLNLCAAALGPLKKDDVLALAPDIFEDSGLLDEAAQAVNRFIIGDGLASGYVFSHPRLAEYFAAKLTDRERQAWQARFLQYGRDTLTALENKTLLPKDAPAYVVQYYAAHLVQTKASATAFYALVCEGWLRAWEWLEGTPAGFLNDAERAWQQAEAEGPAAFGQQIRAALCFASVASLSANISKDLLVVCVKAGVISPALGLVMARQKIEPKERAECLAAIAEFQPLESHAIMSEALSAARAISGERSRAGVLGELGLRLPENAQTSMLTEALMVARAISDERSRAEVLGELAPHLSELEQAQVLGEALSAARAISYEWGRAHTLGALAPWLPEREQTKVLDEALSTAQEISDEFFRAKVLGELAPLLPEHEQAKVFEEALSAVRAISNEWGDRARVLGELVPRLPESLLEEAFSVAGAISEEGWSLDEVLWKLAQRLPEHKQAEVFGEALSAVRAISDEMSRARDLEKLMLYLPENLLGEALSTAHAISDKSFRTEVLWKLALRMPELKQTEILSDVVSEAYAISDASYRACVLAKLAQHLPEHEQEVLYEEALALARTIYDKKSRAHALLKIMPLLPDYRQAVVLEETLVLARTISKQYDRAYVLDELVQQQQLPEYRQAEVFAEACSAACAIPDAAAQGLFVTSKLLTINLLNLQLLPHVSAETFLIACKIPNQKIRDLFLRKLTPRLPEHVLAVVLEEALRTVRAISQEEVRAEILGVLASRLPKREQALVLKKALESARTISESWSRAYVLGELVLQLPEHEQIDVIREALSVGRAISDERHRAEVFGELAPLLPEFEQTELLEEALLVARMISDETDRARVLGNLALRLPEHKQAAVLDEALSAARVISYEGNRAKVLERLTPRLPESLLGEALHMVRTLCHHDESIAVLSSLATRWSAVCRSTQRSEFEELSATLRAFARNKRPQLLQTIQALLPVIAEQGGMPVLRETARAIVDTAKWWP